MWANIAAAAGASLLPKLFGGSGGTVSNPNQSQIDSEYGTAANDASTLSQYGNSNIAASEGFLPTEEAATNSALNYLSQPYGTNTQDESQLNRDMSGMTSNAEAGNAATEESLASRGLAGPAGAGYGSALSGALAGEQSSEVGAVDQAQNQIAQQSIAQHQSNVMQAASLAAQQAGLLNSMGTQPLESGGNLADQTGNLYDENGQQTILNSQVAQQGAANGIAGLGTGILDAYTASQGLPGTSNTPVSAATGSNSGPAFSPLTPFDALDIDKQYAPQGYLPSTPPTSLIDQYANNSMPSWMQGYSGNVGGSAQ